MEVESITTEPVDPTGVKGLQGRKKIFSETLQQGDHHLNNPSRFITGDDYRRF